MYLAQAAPVRISMISRNDSNNFYMTSQSLSKPSMHTDLLLLPQENQRRDYCAFVSKRLIDVEHLLEESGHQGSFGLLSV